MNDGEKVYFPIVSISVEVLFVFLFCMDDVDNDGLRVPANGFICNTTR